MAVTTKYTVDVSGFKKGLEEAQQSVKTFDAALAKNEAQLKKTGDAEEYMKQKSAILEGQIQAQQKVVDAFTAKLKEMADNGDSSSKAYNKMAENLLKAQTKLTNMETELQNVGKESKSADTELRNIGKNITWSNVSEGLKKITDQLESGARAAINFGKRIARSAMDSTSWADDILSRAASYDVDAETLQRMENVAAYIDTDVDTIIKAKDKLANSKGSLPDLLGITTDGKSVDDLFWETGEAIMNLAEASDQSAIAQKVFGKSWRELLPLFTAGRETYEEMIDNQNVLTNEQVENLGRADDAIQSIKQQIEQMKNEFWADNADKITELLQWLIDNKDGVVTALMGIAGAFGAIKVVQFASSLTQVIDGFKTLGFLGGTGATGTGGTPVVAPTGTGGTGIGVLLGTILEKATPIAAAYAASKAFEVLQLYEGLKDMNEAERTKWIIQHDTGMSDEQYYQMQWDKLQEGLDEGSAGGHSFEVKVEPVAADDAAENLSAQVGTVTIQAQLAATGGKVGSTFAGLFGGSSGGSGFANGLPWVMNDGLYLLHRGERVLTASENKTYTYNNNNYFGSVNLNNGQDIDALCDRIDRHNRRNQRGFGE